MLGWGPASFIALFVLSLRCLVMRASVGLHIEGRLAEEPMTGQTGGGLDGPAAVVSRVLPVGYLPPPNKGKGKISEIRYPDGFKYLRVVVRYAEVVALAGLSRRTLKPSLPIINLSPTSKSGASISSRLMLFIFPRWSASLRQPLRMVFAFLCTPS